MHLPPYQPEDLHFAYAYHAYLHWNTHRLHPYPALSQLDAPLLQTLTAGLGVRILEAAASPTEVRILVSLQPGETISACAGKLKGRTSR
jgi:REP element-mobilizing transposase RayT